MEDSNVLKTCFRVVCATTKYSDNWNIPKNNSYLPYTEPKSTEANLPRPINLCRTTECIDNDHVEGRRIFAVIHKYLAI